MSLWVFACLPVNGEYAAQKAGFSLHVKGLSIPYKIMALFVLPSETLRISVADDARHGFRFVSDPVTRESGHRWDWRAPQKVGLHKLLIRRLFDGESIRLHVFVMLPRSAIKDNKLNGYRIGVYPQKTGKHTELYLPPRGFVQITAGEQEIALSPHFRLGQFICKQAGDFPKYVVLQEKMLLKLESLLEALNVAGVDSSGFVIMSGYRTPFYNRQIGNVPLSRHLWGDAADIYIDEHPQDGRMDDLNGDGRRDRTDADWLFDFVERLQGNANFTAKPGGMGAYGSTRYHGPFVHLDVRGYKARWGR